ncbi:MAG TPA: TerB family tellurite resistance protein, partial [Gemmatimonadales bacterium]|nr:TerB family tellurite resistance protein [Gemmatimonadales bacterium]
MLDAIRNFVGRTIARSSASPDLEADPRPPGVQVAAAALLLEVAHADGEFSDAERTHVESALARHLGLDEATTRELMELAEVERRQSIDHFQFTRLIAEHYDLGQKMV